MKTGVIRKGKKASLLMDSRIYDELFSALPDHITIQDRDFKILYQNYSHKKTFGDQAGKVCYSAYQKRESICEGCLVPLTFIDGETHTWETIARTGRGLIFNELKSSPLRDEEGDIVAVVKVVRDITAQKKNEATLKEAEKTSRKAAETLNSLVKASPHAIVALDLEGVVTSWNPAAERIFGWKKKEAVGLRTPFVPEDKKEEAASHLDKIKSGGSITGMRVKRRRKDGTLIDLNLAVSPLKGETGAITGMMAIFEDISARVEMEGRIFQTEQDWKNIFDQITDMITIHDKDFNIIRSNTAAENALGLPAPVKSGAKCYTYYHGRTSPPEGCPSCKCMKTGRPASFELFEPYLKKFLEITAIPRFDINHRVSGLIHIVRDITERKRLESIAQSANLMDNLGYIFSGIRHEMINPVHSTRMALTALKKKLPGGVEKIEEYLDIALAQTDKLEFLLKSLRNFNMFEDVEIREHQVANFVKKMLALVKHDFADRKIEITAEIGPDVESALFDERALQQVLLNLFTNAADALAGTGQPRIILRARRLGNTVLFVVEDNGPGMSREEIKNLFKPFFTTKKKGTGLGLVLVKKMMLKMKGAMEILSEEGRGTAVNLILPARLS